MCFYFIFNVEGNIIGEADDVLREESKVKMQMKDLCG